MSPLTRRRSLNPNQQFMTDLKKKSDEKTRTKPLRAWLALWGLLLFQPTLFAQYALTYATNGSAITLTGYTGNPDNVTIPNFVTAIGGKAFENCGSISSLTIPESVTNIGASAFQGCDQGNLRWVLFAGAAPAIDRTAFMYDYRAGVHYNRRASCRQYCFGIRRTSWSMARTAPAPSFMVRWAPTAHWRFRPILTAWPSATLRTMPSTACSGL